MARNCPVSCKSPTLIVLGMMERDNSGEGAGVAMAVMVAIAETTEPSGLESIAVMVVVPTLAPVTIPLPDARPDETDAMVGTLEIHLICGELVTSMLPPVLPMAPRATNCAFCPEAER